jgi:putative ATPase
MSNAASVQNLPLSPLVCYHQPMNTTTLPLATQLRPTTLQDFIGQTHIVGTGKPLRAAIEKGHCHSMIFWGPPGTGKTTLAHLLAASVNAEFEVLSAVFSGVKEIREVITRARKRLPDKRTLLFIDEVHRFNKAQQDAFLPIIEDGTVIFIGATTENPSFSLNNALLSRARVYVLKSLTAEELLPLIDKALHILQLHMPTELRLQLAHFSDGDARRCLNYLEIIGQYALSQTQTDITEELMQSVLNGGQVRRFDKQGDDFYDQISALHKSVRGSDPDAAIYWFARMVDGGCDPAYLARRVVRMATEDIGNADPRALQLALNAYDSYDKLGSPEGELAIAQAIIYMAVCAKSNAVYVAYQKARAECAESGSLPVPLHLRNAVTPLMKQLDYGKNYRYAHDEPEAYAKGENYFPDGLAPKSFYNPVARGLEIKIAEKLKQLKKK